jgi:serpin B
MSRNQRARLGVSRAMKPLVMLLACALLVGCGSTGAIDLARSTVARADAPAADANLAADAVNAFGFDVLRQVDQHQNAVISPPSIAIALGMARAGARGETASQMDQVLHDVASDAHPTWLNALDATLTSRTGTFKDASGTDQQVTLRIANAPFAQKDEAWNQDFLDALATRFGAGVRLVDYKSATEAARQAINAWVSDQTEQRIRELLAQGTLDDMTRLVLVNAVYLKAQWQHAFEPTLTKPATFTRPDGSMIQVPTMHLETELSYAQGAGWRAVELPYVGGELAMTLILPDDPTAFVLHADDQTLAVIVAGLKTRQPLVTLAFPKFSFETKTDLVSVLGALGMPDAFRPPDEPNGADFSAMTTQEGLFISHVIHQATIDVDEKGTTATAATAAVAEAASLPADHVTLDLNRPFLFALRDTTTGAIVFLGEVTDPSATSPS